MPRLTNYPRKSLDSAINVAENVEKLGGKCLESILAERMGKKISGSFSSEIATAVKHGLITKDGNNLKITDLFKDIKLSYTESEKNGFLVKAFLIPETYREVLERFNGGELPIDMLDRILIREYSVVEDISKSVANNIIKGAEKLGLIVNGKVSISDHDKEIIEEVKTEVQDLKQNESPENKNVNSEIPTINKNIDKVNFTGINREVVLNLNIQLSVPETTNEEVYEKFFAAMKRHLLS